MEAESRQWRSEGSAAEAQAPLVLALHGQGMDGESLSRIFAPLFTLPIRFLFPTAPLKSPGGLYPGPSWYEYDGNQERFVAELQRTENELLYRLGRIESQAGWEPRARVLFGFSQGGYCGAYLALRNFQLFDGLIVSGARVKSEVLAEPLRHAALSEFEVLLCHGRRDRHVSLEAAQTSYEALVAAGVPVTLRIFASGHAMGAEQVEAIRDWLVHHFRLE